jgi:hypothetical protein
VPKWLQNKHAIREICEWKHRQRAPNSITIELQS